jgi:hypothetical protein
MKRMEHRLIVSLGMVALGTCGACSSVEQGDMEPSGSPDSPHEAQPENEGNVDAERAEEQARMEEIRRDNARYLVAEIELEEGHVAQIFERAPGALFYVEQFRRDQHSVLDHENMAEPVKVFSRLSPNTPVPESLRAAEERARAFERALPVEQRPRVLEPALPVEGVALEVGGSPAALAPLPGARLPGSELGVARQANSQTDPTHFIADHYGCEWDPAVQGKALASICRINWAFGFAGSTSSSLHQVKLDHYAGNGIVVRLRVAGVIFQDTFFPATSFGIVGSSGGGVKVRSVEVIEISSGDRWHVGTTWH